MSTKDIMKKWQTWAIVGIILFCTVLIVGINAKKSRQEKAVDEMANVQFGLSPEVPKIKRLEANTWSSPFVILDNRVRTFPEGVAVEFKDIETGKIIVMAPHSDIHLAGVNMVQIRAAEKIRYIVERQ